MVHCHVFALSSTGVRVCFGSVLTNVDAARFPSTEIFDRWGLRHQDLQVGKSAVLILGCCQGTYMKLPSITIYPYCGNFI